MVEKLCGLSLFFFKRGTGALFFVMVVFFGCQNPARAGTPFETVSLLPKPAQITLTSEMADAGRGLSIVWTGHRSPRLDRAAQRFARQLQKVIGQKIPLEPKGGLPFHIRCRDPDTGMAGLGLAMSEHYVLQVTDEGIFLEADGPAGILRGFSTLLQLAMGGENGARIHGAIIDDAPRYPWRGLMIDVARHFMSPAALKRQIEAMAFVKMNVLHLHLSDGQAFRVESKAYPLLQEKTPDGAYYTQSDLKDLVSYAYERGVRVVPEIDLPGHSYAILQAYPSLASQPLKADDYMQVWNAALNPVHPQTRELAKGIYNEIATIFPDAYFHMGGDEVSARQWTTNRDIAAYMHAHNISSAAQLQGQFTRYLADVLAGARKSPIAWDEVLQAWAPASIIIQVWRSSKFTAQATQMGHRVIVSAGYYLDLLLPAADYYRINPQDPQAYGLSEADIAKLPAKRKFLEPFGRDLGAHLDEAQKRLVLGGEAALWSEVVSEQMLDARIWPRTAAIAERLWSSAAERDIDSLYVRLHAIIRDMNRLGLKEQENRRRMMEALSPGDIKPIETLLQVCSPVRNYAHNHQALQIRQKQKPTEQPLDRLSDIASPDTLEAEYFNIRARLLVAGDHGMEGPLRAALLPWRDNDAAFVALSERRPLLKEARYTSRLVRELAQAGLDALDVIHGQTPATGWRERARRALQQARHDIAASDTTVAVRLHPQQPPADLLITIVPGVSALVDYASKH